MVPGPKEEEGAKEVKTGEGEDSEIEVNIPERQNEEAGKKENSDDFDYEERARKIFEEKGKPFMSEVLPKLPKQRNGMRLLGVHEQSPVLGSGELFKIRMYRPDKPLVHSEVYEDGSRLRFTNLSRLVCEDFIISKFKMEAVIFKVGLADQDTTGHNATKGVFEAEDMCNLTIRPFLEKKMKGKQMTGKNNRQINNI